MEHGGVSTVTAAFDVLREILIPVATKVREAEDTGLYEVLMGTFERCLIEYALKTQRSQMAAAELLGLSRNTLRRKMCRYNITHSESLHRRTQ